MKRTQLYLPPELHEQAARLAAELGSTLSDVVRVALDDFLQRRRKQRRDFLTALDRVSGIWRHRTDLADEQGGGSTSSGSPSWPPAR